jgi:hypothetical protein
MWYLSQEVMTVILLLEWESLFLDVSVKFDAIDYFKTNLRLMIAKYFNFVCLKLMRLFLPFR